MNNAEKNNYETAIGEAQEYYGNQSGKVATISRTLVYGMITTVWVVSYSDGAIQIPHPILLVALFCCFIYLLFDLSLYFANACRYHKQQILLEEHKGKNDAAYIAQNGEYNKTMISIHNKAFIWICIKFGLFIVTAISFLIGLYCHLLV